MEETNIYISNIISKFPVRPMDANKGTFGKVLIIAGSGSFPGSAYLCAAAGYRVGAGLVTLAAIKSVCEIVSKKIPEATYLILSEKAGCIARVALKRILEKIGRYKCLLIGPGIGINCGGVEKIIPDILSQENLPDVVLDADGLNILSQTESWWQKLNFKGVLTPHLKEFSRLTSISLDEIKTNKRALAKEYAKKWNKIVVLKGANTVVASPDGQVLISPFVNPLLATAGTGDVLAGIIAGFIAQGLSAFDASVLGTFIHGQTAENLKNKFGDTGMIASDLLIELPRTIKSLKEEIKS